MKKLAVVAMMLAALALPCAADDVYLDFTPGWTDATFDGSDHQTSGIDVYIDPDFGAIPAVPDPTPVEVDESNKSFDLFSATPATAPAARRADESLSRLLAIAYKDGKTQYVPLRDVFANVTRLTVVTDSTVQAAHSGFLGSWQTTVPLWGRLTLRAQGSALAGRMARNGQLEASLRDPRTLEGTWSNGGRSGRVLMTLAEDGQRLVGRWYYGMDGAGGDFAATKTR